MKCGDVKVVIVTSYTDNNHTLNFEYLQKRINDVLEDNPERGLVDIRIIGNRKAMVILER